jgi:hypothetical protein
MSPHVLRASVVLLHGRGDDSAPPVLGSPDARPPPTPTHPALLRIGEGDAAGRTRSSSLLESPKMVRARVRASERRCGCCCGGGDVGRRC